MSDSSDSPTLVIRVEDADPMLGRQVRDFRILECIGRGGMGAVYKAEHRLLGELRALKMMRAELFRALPNAVERFQREARIAVKLRHPNLVLIHDFFVEDGDYFLVMEHVVGRSLANLLAERGALSVEETCKIGIQCCAGLAHAHEMGIVHRDLSPENILLEPSPDGPRVKIIDFGVARAAFAGDEAGGGTAGTLTRVGEFLGKPRYASPEQAGTLRRGETLDARSDLYTLGLILFEMLTESFPFRSENAVGYLSQHALQPPAAPTQLRPDLAIPAGLEQVILRCLEKDRARRFASARELGAALEWALRSGDPADAPFEWRPREPASDEIATRPLRREPRAPARDAAPRARETDAPERDTRLLERDTRSGGRNTPGAGRETPSGPRDGRSPAREARGTETRGTGETRSSTGETRAPTTRSMRRRRGRRARGRTQRVALVAVATALPLLALLVGGALWWTSEPGASGGASSSAAAPLARASEAAPAARAESRPATHAAEAGATRACARGRDAPARARREPAASARAPEPAATRAPEAATTGALESPATAPAPTEPPRASGAASAPAEVPKARAQPRAEPAAAPFADANEMQRAFDAALAFERAHDSAAAVANWKAFRRRAPSRELDEQAKRRITNLTLGGLKGFP